VSRSNKQTRGFRDVVSFGNFYGHADRRRQAGRAPKERLSTCFDGAKVCSPIKIGSQLQLDLATQCSLDPAVHALGFLPALQFAGSVVDIQMLVADFDEGRFALDIVDDRPPRDVDTEGLQLLAIADRGLGLMEFCADEILSEPYVSNCRRVWSYRTDVIAPSTIASVTEVLRSDASMSIGELSKAVQFPGAILPTVCSMACADLIELDLAYDLSDRTLVSIRKSALAAVEILPWRK
jgi:hypothetical protein